MIGAGPKMCIVVYGGTGYIGRAAVRVAQMGLLNGIRAWMFQQIGCLQHDSCGNMVISLSRLGALV